MKPTNLEAVAIRSKLLSIIAENGLSITAVVSSMDLHPQGTFGRFLHDKDNVVGVRAWAKVFVWLEKYDKGEIFLPSLISQRDMSVAALISYVVDPETNMAELSRKSSVHVNIIQGLRRGLRSRISKRNYLKLSKAIYE